MGVDGNLTLEERHLLRSAGLPEIVERQPRPLALMDRGVALHVGEGKIGLPIASVGGAQQRKQCRVLRNRQQLPVAKGPAPRGEVEREDTYFGNEWIGHSRAPKSGWGKSRTAK